MSDFHRIKRLPASVFEQVNKIKAIPAPGDVILVTNPSYPIHAFRYLMTNGAMRWLSPSVLRGGNLTRHRPRCSHG